VVSGFFFSERKSEAYNHANIREQILPSGKSSVMHPDTQTAIICKVPELLSVAYYCSLWYIEYKLGNPLFSYGEGSL